MAGSKILSAAATIAAARRDADVILLVEVALTSPSAKTLYFSDAFRTEIGHEYLPFVLGFGTVDEAQNDGDVGGRVTTATLRLQNSKTIEGKTRLSSLIRTAGNTSGTYEFTFAKVTVSELLVSGAAAGDEVVLGVFYLEDNPDINEEFIDFRMSDAALLLEDKMLIRRLTNDDFPLADPDDVGQDIPVAISGGLLKDIPCLGAVTGWVSSSTADITATAPGVGGWLTVSDDRAPSSAIGQFDDEQIEWDQKRTKPDAPNLGVPQVRIKRRGIPRTGVLVTVSKATAHKAGAALFQIRSGVRAYGYLVCENVGAYRLLAGSITNVRVANVLQVDSGANANVTIDYAYAFPNLPGRTFVVIWFKAVPVLKKQVVVAIEDKLTVGDNIAVTAANGTTLTRLATNLPTTVIASSGSAGSVTLTLPAAPGGITNVNRKIGYIIRPFAPSTTGWKIKAGDRVLESNDDSGNPPPLGYRSFRWGTGASYGNETIAVEFRGLSGDRLVVTIIEYEAEVEAALGIAKTGAASRAGTLSLTGNSTADVVVGGQVTCDIAAGVRDNGSGTITGTAGAIIRYPADVAKFILLALFPGVTAADLGTSWTATRATHKAGNYKWDMLLTALTMSELRRKIGEQCRSALYLEGGKWELRLIDAAKTAPTTQITLDDDTHLLAVAPVTVSHTPRTAIRNSLTVYAARDYRKTGGLADRYTVARVRESLSGFADRLKYDLEFDFIQDSTMITTIADVWLGWWKRQRLIVACVVPWVALSAEKYDVVQITGHPVLDDMAPSGRFRIIGKSYLLGDADNPGRIALRMIESNP